MSADLVDPFATPEPERVTTCDMCDAITYKVRNSRNDPELLPQLIQRTIRELRRAADDETQDGVLTIWARWLLTDLWHRAESGVPYGEPREPADSLDSERGLHHG